MSSHGAPQRLWRGTAPPPQPTAPIPRCSNSQDPRRGARCRSAGGGGLDRIVGKAAAAAEGAPAAVRAPEGLARRLAFSFSPSGLLFPYYIGVLQALRETDLVTSDTPVSGSSGGCLLAVFNACGIAVEDIRKTNRLINTRLLARPGDKILGEVVKDAMLDLLPNDVHTTVSNRIAIAITRLAPFPWPLVVEDFLSKEDLVDVMVASTYMPGMAGTNLGVATRHGLAGDGMLARFYPEVPEAYRDRVKTTIKVCPAPSEARPWFVGSADISPDLRSPEDRYPKDKYYHYASEPFDLDILDDFIRDGYNDTLTWAQRFLQTSRQYN
ncbi:unnamed protein product [Ostreobium quekettii]|uniref:Patatin n=1 Tax=Ostreobium quekettii TaxID=121088 RepID=A0A8S1JED0_9CHLO|nr:unnamed protein product [Ostreobium quekettii]